MLRISSFMVLAAFQFETSFAKNQPKAIVPLEIGSNSENTGFENMTCAQMIASYGKYLSEANISPQANRSRYRACGALSKKDEKLTCIKEVDILVDRFERAEINFINALEMRQAIYDLNNLDKSMLKIGCKNYTAATYNRPKTLSDAEYRKKFMVLEANECKIKAEYEFGPAEALKAKYKSKDQYEDMDKCLNMRINLGQQRSEPFSSGLKRIEDSVAQEEKFQKQCKAFDCKVEITRQTNLKSDCYRDMIVFCQVNPGGSYRPERDKPGQSGYNTGQ